MSDWKFRPLLETSGERIVPSATEAMEKPPQFPPAQPPASPRPPQPGETDPRLLAHDDLIDEMHAIDVDISEWTYENTLTQNKINNAERERTAIVNAILVAVAANNSAEINAGLADLRRIDEVIGDLRYTLYMTEDDITRPREVYRRCQKNFCADMARPPTLMPYPPNRLWSPNFRNTWS